MRREIVQPTEDEYGHEEHPAWVLIGASRVSSTPGAVLFDSDIRHQHYVVVRIAPARRKRDLHHDWLGSTRAPYVEVAMSEAQWASFVSSMNAGDGVPATLIERDGHDVPGVPYEPRLAQSMDEVRDAAERAAEKVRAAFETYKEKKTVGNLRVLQAAIENMPANIEYSAATLTGHAENVVQRARADIEAMVVSKAQQLGLNLGDITSETLQLTTGEEELDDHNQDRDA